MISSGTHRRPADCRQRYSAGRDRRASERQPKCTASSTLHGGVTLYRSHGKTGRLTGFLRSTLRSRGSRLKRFLLIWGKVWGNGARKAQGAREGAPVSWWISCWLRGVDLNHRPLGYEPNELPGCSTPLLNTNNCIRSRQTCVNIRRAQTQANVTPARSSPPGAFVQGLNTANRRLDCRAH